MKKFVTKLSIPLFIFFLFIAWSTPLTGDDWTWGSNAGTDRLANWFKDYNGRYFSNIIEIVLTRIEWVRVLFVALSSTLLVLLTGRMVKMKKKNVSYLLSFVLFMLVPIKIYAQTFGWLAGYVNYVLSMVLLLIFLNIVKNVLEDEEPLYKKELMWLIIPLGFFTQLIVEHVTLFSIFTVFLVIVYTKIKFKKTFILHWAYFVSSVLGALVMFTNGAYLKVLSGEDTYRSVREDVGLIERFYTTYKESMYTPLFMDNTLMITLMSISLLGVFLFTNQKVGNIQKILKYGQAFIIIAFTMFVVVFKKVLGVQYLGSFTSDVEAIFTLIYSATLLVSVCMWITNKQTKMRLVYYVIGMVFLVLPFVFITPFGPRCVFGTYVFMVLFTIELINYVFENNGWSLAGTERLLQLSAVVLMVAFAFIIGMNGYANKERIQHIQEAVSKGKMEVKMTELPYPQYHWMGTPRDGIYQAQTFRIFYELPKDLKIEIIPHFKSQRKLVGEK